MKTERSKITEEEAQNIRYMVLIEAADYFRDMTMFGGVANVLDEFAYRASWGLTIVPDEEEDVTSWEVHKNCLGRGS